MLVKTMVRKGLEKKRMSKTRDKEISVSTVLGDFDIKIMDSSHISVRLSGEKEWGIPLRYDQVAPSIIVKLREQGYSKGESFTLAGEDPRPKEVKFPDLSFAKDSLFISPEEIKELGWVIHERVGRNCRAFNPRYGLEYTGARSNIMEKIKLWMTAYHLGKHSAREHEELGTE